MVLCLLFWKNLIILEFIFSDRVDLGVVFVVRFVFLVVLLELMFLVLDGLFFLLGVLFFFFIFILIFLIFIFDRLFLYLVLFFELLLLLFFGKSVKMFGVWKLVSFGNSLLLFLFELFFDFKFDFFFSFELYILRSGGVIGFGGIFSFVE